MNHQPFRDWLLAEEQLTVEQKSALQEHMATCQACSQLNAAWLQVETTFHQVDLASPSANFTQRWQAKLAEYQRRRNEKRIWAGIGTSLVLGISLLILSITQIWSFVQSPSQFLELWFNSLINIASLYFALVDQLHSVSGSTVAYTFLGMILLIGVISFMSVLWLATYRKLSMVRRTA